MKKNLQNLLLVFYLLALIFLGIRGYLLEDTRFSWGMFRNQIDYQIDYFWVMASGERLPHQAGDELKRGGPRALMSQRRHRTRYGIGAVRSWAESYLNYLWEDRRPEGAQSIEATIEYQINREGDRIPETLRQPRTGAAP